ncbi:MAG: FGGY-family carbohydrate kinase [Candidatus Korarchaeum sp.]|nr:FGGY-family carbohydrate kinase [Candidatus Korarchaeum sp.]MDW8035146.1 FGGY-family carbohydrate kinase [Candidatus Korarchaeum sp.]
MYGVIDIGTTGIKLSVYDEELKKVHQEKVIVGFEHLEGGFVEQSSVRILEIVKGLVRRSRDLGVRKIGICTYRASVLAWKDSGEPLTNVITWIDGRGREITSKLPKGVRFLMRLSKSLRTVLSPDSPAVLLKWIYETIGIYKEVEDGKAFAWTLDSFLLYNLTGKFVSDPTNATLTGLIHPKDLREIELVFDLLKLPRVIPDVVDNVHEFGRVDDMDLSVSIADQQSATVGMGVLERGRVESTHGTGSFLEAVTSGFLMPKGGLIPVVILSVDGRRTYGLEGFIRSTGSTVDWLKEVGLFESYDEMERLAEEGKKGPVLVPSLGGLKVPGAQHLRGCIAGLSLSTGRADVLSGVAWGISLHLALILELLRSHLGSLREPLLAAGGYSKSNVFLRRLADLSGMRVARPKDVEASSSGVAKLLAYSDGELNLEDLKELPDLEEEFEPAMEEEVRRNLIQEYSKLLEVLVKWEENPFLKGAF